MNDSDEDADSQFELGDNVDGVANDGPYQVVVANAGNGACNGVYHQDGYFSEACRYVMEGRGTNNSIARYYIFQCNVSNNTKHWYISIVPRGSNPGTSSDIDFYSAPVTETCRRVPPCDGWVKAPVGTDPPPVLSHRLKNPEDDGTTDPELKELMNNERLQEDYWVGK